MRVVTPLRRASESLLSKTSGESENRTGEGGNAQRARVTDAHERTAWMAVGGRVLGVVFCLLCLVGGTLFGHLYWNSKEFREAFNRNPLGIVADVARLSPLENWTPNRQFAGRSTLNVLVLGVDHDYDNKARIIPTSNGRSDSILIARVDFANNTISALTIPRDTAVYIPGRRGIHKINAAHSFGGPDLTIETLRSVFGLEVDCYVTINFEGFEKVVDAIGGIELDVEKRLKYDDNWGKLHINLYPGYQHLTGYQAMGYVRMRHSDSDEMRSKRQHKFLEAVRVKLRNPTTFMALPRAIDTLVDSIKLGNMTKDQMFALANYARSLPKENIVVKTLPSIEGPSYVTIETAEAAQVISEMFYPGEFRTVTIDAPDPATVRALNARYDRRGGRRVRTGTVSVDHQEPEPGIESGPSLPPDTGSGPAEPPATPATPPDTPPSGAGLSVEDPPTQKPGHTGAASGEGSA